MPKNHHWIFYRPNTLPVNQPTMSEHWQHKHIDTCIYWYRSFRLQLIQTLTKVYVICPISRSVYVCSVTTAPSERLRVMFKMSSHCYNHHWLDGLRSLSMIRSHIWCERPGGWRHSLGSLPTAAAIAHVWSCAGAVLVIMTECNHMKCM